MNAHAPSVCLFAQEVLVFLTEVRQQLGTDSWTKEQLKEFVSNNLNSGKVRSQMRVYISHAHVSNVHNVLV